MTVSSYAAIYPHTCNKALYVAMALLFGTFGVHKFALVECGWACFTFCSAGQASLRLLALLKVL